MPLLEGLKVVASKIHGYGVVTTRPFTKGEVICFGDGVLYREDDDFDDTYALVLPGEDSGLGDKYFWDLVCQTRWFNHSCDPNSEVDPNCYTDETAGRVWIIALRDIAAGEELTRENVRSIRPGHGLPPKHLPEVLGRKAAHNLKRGDPLDWASIS